MPHYWTGWAIKSWKNVPILKRKRLSFSFIKTMQGCTSERFSMEKIIELKFDLLPHLPYNQIWPPLFILPNLKKWHLMVNITVHVKWGSYHSNRSVVCRLSKFFLFGQNYKFFKYFVKCVEPKGDYVENEIKWTNKLVLLDRFLKAY